MKFGETSRAPAVRGLRQGRSRGLSRASLRAAGSWGLVLGGILVLACGCGRYPQLTPDADGVFHVHPGENIQAALESAARHPTAKTVRVHAGVYRPTESGQALIWLNAKHHGITLEAEGDVTLTAANPEIAEPNAQGAPAVVNHVVYFGDGIGRKTVLRGFKITGANHFVTKEEGREPIQPPLDDPELVKHLFFYCDGGGIKIFGRSYPTIENVEIHDNFASPCGGGISIEHRGYNGKAVELRNCIFRDNRCQVTGSAVDVLPGSAAVIENCLFVGNVSNVGHDYVSPKGEPYHGEHGSGALTVFAGSRVTVRRCTFTGNWNGVDDEGTFNRYEACLFWHNTRTGGVAPKGRYELDMADGRGVRNCHIAGETPDLRGTISRSQNTIGGPDPDFDERLIPRAAEYSQVGYRPLDMKDSK